MQTLEKTLMLGALVTTLVLVVIGLIAMVAAYLGNSISISGILLFCGGSFGFLWATGGGRKSLWDMDIPDW